MKTALTTAAILFALPLATLTGCGKDVGAGDTPAATKRAARAETLEVREIGTVKNVHAWGDMLIASQPQEADLLLLKEAGIRTVINLRNVDEMTGFDEPAAVEALGMTYVALPFNGPEQLTDEVFDQGRELLETAEEPIFFHCASANRCGAIWIPWRVLDGGIELEQAMGEAKQMGLRTEGYVTNAQAYIERAQ